MQIIGRDQVVCGAGLLERLAARKETMPKLLSNPRLSSDCLDLFLIDPPPIIYFLFAMGRKISSYCWSP